MFRVEHQGTAYLLITMAKTNRPSGSWVATQRAELVLKFKKGKVKHTDRSTNYLWHVCNFVEFKPFISNNPSGKSTAISHVQKEFLHYKQTLQLNGAWQGMCLIFPAYFFIGFLSNILPSQSPDSLPASVNLEKVDGMKTQLGRPIASSQYEECEQLNNLLERTTISGSNFVPHSFGPKNYDMVAYQTTFCKDGHDRAVFDFNVYSQHKRNYLVTMGKGGNLCSL